MYGGRGNIQLLNNITEISSLNKKQNTVDTEETELSIAERQSLLKYGSSDVEVSMFKSSNDFMYLFELK